MELGAKMEKLIEKCKEWIERDHTGEIQIGHHGFTIGENGENLISLSVNFGYIWINITSKIFDLNYKTTIDKNKVIEIKNICKKLGLKIIDDWNCSKGYASHSFHGIGWKIHPTSMSMCKPIGINKEAKIIG